MEEGSGGSENPGAMSGLKDFLIILGQGDMGGSKYPYATIFHVTITNYDSRALLGPQGGQQAKNKNALIMMAHIHDSDDFIQKSCF